MNSLNSDGRPFRTLGDMFFYSLNKYQNTIFQYLDETNETTTYLEILQWGIRTAIKLKKKGISQDDVISTCTHNQKYSSVPFIAAQFIGAVPSAFDPNLSQLDTIHLLNIIKPKILFVAEESLEFMENCLHQTDVTTEIVVFGQSKKYVEFELFLEPTVEEKKFVPTEIEDNTETAVILFSSGSSGHPKGICLSHRALLKVAYEKLAFDGTYNDIAVMSFTTLYWISAAFLLIKSVLKGYSSVMYSKFDPGHTWELIKKYKVNTMFLAPYHAVDFLKCRPVHSDTSSLEYFLTGSCALPQKTFEELRQCLPHTKIIMTYGQTETAGTITMFDSSDPEQYEMLLRKPGSCGIMKTGIKWKVVDINSGKTLGPNEKGELRLKYDGYLLNGYYKMDSSSIYDSEGYLKTGDIVYYDEEECFYVVDRVKEMFKYRGWHILPAVVENEILSHPAVKEAVVFGIPHKIDGDHPMAVVVLNEGCGDSAEDLETFVNAKVADSQKLRAGIKIVECLPRTVTGKINRKCLKEMVLRNEI